MFASFYAVLGFLSLALSQTAAAAASDKRGLIYISENNQPVDSALWIRSGSDITWYYNYLANPSNIASDSLEYVPMLWGPSSKPGIFYDGVTSLQSQGVKISHVLGFNEPDGPKKTGGSDMSVDQAVQAWKSDVQPLKKLGIQLGSPATQGNSAGIQWLLNFFKKCQGCDFDFICIHWYGSFEGFASYVGQAYEQWHKPLWVTEFAIPNVSLNETQLFYNQSIPFLDNLTYVERYSYFGSFRSSASNIGPNAAMLTQDGKLTDIGSWYLGGGWTGNIPLPNFASSLSLPRTVWLVIWVVVFCEVL